MKKCQTLMIVKEDPSNPKNSQITYLCKEFKDKYNREVRVSASLCTHCVNGNKEFLFHSWLNPGKRTAKILPYKQLSVLQMGMNFVKALVTFAKDGFKRTSKKEFIERCICCDSCGGGGSCPYCGCLINLKARMNSEKGCPNPETYPGLPKYPPKNYWQVCKETTSIIIPARNEKYLDLTIKNLAKNAVGKIEVIVVLDGYNQSIQQIKGLDIKVLKFDKVIGKRAAVNAGAAKAKGKYLFFIDSHCTMSEGWDTRLKYACGEKDLVVSSIIPIDEKTWKRKSDGGVYRHVYLTQSLEEKWWNRSVNLEGPLFEETMAFTACGWMIQKAYFDSLGGHDDLSLGHWGYEGAEWALKVWLNKKDPGRVLLRQDVYCGHLFNTNANSGLYKAEMITLEEFHQKMVIKYGDKIQVLFTKFDISDWNDSPPKTVVVERVTETVIKDNATGKILARKVNKIKV